MKVTKLENLIASACAEFSPQSIEVRAGHEIVEYFRAHWQAAPDGFWVEFKMNYQPYRFSEAFKPVPPFGGGGVSSEWMHAPLEAVLFRTPTKTVHRIVRRPRS